MRVAMILASTFAVSALALAQDATVKVKHGDVIVTGDGGANILTIDDAGLAAGQLRVTPQFGTTVNGSTSAFVANGFTRDLRLDLGDGDDDVVLQEVEVSRDVRCDLGRGADTIIGTSVAVLRNLSIVDSSEDASIQFTGMAITGAVKIRTGSGNDVIDMQGNTGAAFKVASGAGDDHVSLTAAQVGKNAKFDLGPGANDLDVTSTFLKKGLKARAGSAADSLDLFDVSVTRKASIDLGGGGDAVGFKQVTTASDVDLRDVAKWSTDTVTIGRSARCAAKPTQPIESHLNTLVVAGELRVVGSSKADFLALDVNSEVDGSARFEFAGGDNEIELAQVAVLGDLRVFTGGGDDTITLTGASVGGVTKVKHGGGADVVTP